MFFEKPYLWKASGISVQAQFKLIPEKEMTPSVVRNIRAVRSFHVYMMVEQ